MIPDNFVTYGRMHVWVQTEKERNRVSRFLEDDGVFQSREAKQTNSQPVPGLFVMDLKRKEYTYSILPCTGMLMHSYGDRIYSASEFFHMAEHGFRRVPRFLVFHVPHDGQEFPLELMDSVRIPEELFRVYHRKMMDADIGRIVPLGYRTQSMYFHFDVSRLLCDVERFIGPGEIMEQYGMGFCYEKVYDGTKIKQVTEELKKKTGVYYWNHHRKIDRICEKYSRVLVLDLHSYSDEIVPNAFWKKDIPSPDICIGADGQYTPPELVRTVRKHFEAAGYSVEVNYPYTGTYVPNAILSHGVSCDCVSVMLEINRRIYFGRNGQSDPEKLDGLQEIVQSIIDDCTGI